MDPSTIVMEAQEYYRWITWSPDGTMLASVADESLKVLRLDKDIKGSVTTVGSNQGELEQCCWNPQDNNLVATASKDKPAIVWDVRTRSPAMSLNLPPKNKNIDWSYDANYLALIDKDNLVHVVDVRSNTAFKETPPPSTKQRPEINQICWQPQSESLFVPQPGNLLCALKWQDMVEHKNLIHLNVKSSSYTLTTMAFDSSGRRFAVGGSDGIVSVCDREDFNAFRCFGRFDASVVTSISFDDTGEYVCASYISKVSSDRSTDPAERYFDITHIETGDLVQLKIEKDKQQSICTWNPRRNIIALAPTRLKGNIEIIQTGT